MLPHLERKTADTRLKYIEEREKDIEDILLGQAEVVMSNIRYMNDISRDMNKQVHELTREIEMYRKAPFWKRLNYLFTKIMLP